MSSYDFETGATLYNAPAMDAGQIWRCAMAQAEKAARQALPESSHRIEAAVTLIHDGKVALHADGTASVGSTRTPETVYPVSETCPCPDFSNAPQGQCKHKIARGLLVRALQFAKALGEAQEPVSIGPEDMALDLDGPIEMSTTVLPILSPPAPALTIPAQFLVTIQGKQFVTYHGLLALATQHGLVSLSAEFIAVTPELALAKATAVFQDGRTFTEAADSTPTNVNGRIRPHFPRMSLTRAKARCLRDALNLAMVAVEELE
jgi:hypothetical protein